MKPEAVLTWHDPHKVVRNLQSLYKVLRGNVSYGNLKVGDVSQNIDGCPAIVTTPMSTGTVFAVAHNLNRVPIGYHVINKSIPVDVYDGGTTWTTQDIYLKADAASVLITLFIF